MWRVQTIKRKTHVLTAEASWINKFAIYGEIDDANESTGDKATIED